MRIILRIFLGFVLCYLAVTIIGVFLESKPPAQTPEESGMSPEPALVACASLYGVAQTTTDPPAREALANCVTAMRKAH